MLSYKQWVYNSALGELSRTLSPLIVLIATPHLLLSTLSQQLALPQEHFNMGVSLSVPRLHSKPLPDILLSNPFVTAAMPYWVGKIWWPLETIYLFFRRYISHPILSSSGLHTTGINNTNNQYKSNKTRQ